MLLIFVVPFKVLANCHKIVHCYACPWLWKLHFKLMLCDILLEPNKICFLQVFDHCNLHLEWSERSIFAIVINRDIDVDRDESWWSHINTHTHTHTSMELTVLYRARAHARTHLHSTSSSSHTRLWAPTGAEMATETFDKQKTIDLRQKHVG